MVVKIVDQSMVKVIVPPKKRTRITVTIAGITPLLTDRIPDDAIPDPEPGCDTKSKKKKEVTAEEIYLRSRYMIDEKTHGFPASGIKRAMVSACRQAPKLTMAKAPSLFKVLSLDHEEYIKLRFKEVKHARHYGRNKNVKGGAALIKVHRAMYIEWEMDIVIEFNENELSVQDVVNLLSIAGDGGIGAYRRENMGNYGEFDVKEGKTKVA